MLEFGYENSEPNTPGDSNKNNVYCHCQNIPGLTNLDETE